MGPGAGVPKRGEVQVQASGLHLRCRCNLGAGLPPAPEVQVQASGLHLGLGARCALALLGLWEEEVQPTPRYQHQLV